MHGGNIQARLHPGFAGGTAQYPDGCTLLPVLKPFIKRAGIFLPYFRIQSFPEFFQKSTGSAIERCRGDLLTTIIGHRMQIIYFPGHIIGGLCQAFQENGLLLRSSAKKEPLLLLLIFSEIVLQPGVCLLRSQLLFKQSPGIPGIGSGQSGKQRQEFKGLRGCYPLELTTLFCCPLLFVIHPDQALHGPINGSNTLHGECQECFKGPGRRPCHGLHLIHIGQ